MNDKRLNTLITDPKERTKRSQQKREAVLKFLRDEVWSTSEIIAEVMGVKTRQAVNKLLLTLMHEEKVKRATIDVGAGRGITLWGLTTHGLAFSFDEDEEIKDIPVFEPSRVAVSTLPHRLDIQKARLKALANGWKDWTPCDRGEFIKTHGVQHRPDALAVNPEGELVAIEVERTIKTRSRYQQVIASHLKAMSDGKWAHVYYITPEGVSDRLKKVIYSIDTIKVGGQQVQLKGSYLERFTFVDLDKWIVENDKK